MNILAPTSATTNNAKEPVPVSKSRSLLAVDSNNNNTNTSSNNNNNNNNHNKSNKENKLNSGEQQAQTPGQVELERGGGGATGLLGAVEFGAAQIMSQLHNANNNANTMNPFLLSPFLAAFAAAAQNQQQQNNHPNQQQQQQQQSLLNNISNLAMLSNFNGGVGVVPTPNGGKQQQIQQNELWPWFNMAAMSALYGFDSESKYIE